MKLISQFGCGCNDCKPNNNLLLKSHRKYYLSIYLLIYEYRKSKVTVQRLKHYESSLNHYTFALIHSVDFFSFFIYAVF